MEDAVLFHVRATYYQYVPYCIRFIRSLSVYALYLPQSAFIYCKILIMNYLIVVIKVRFT